MRSEVQFWSALHNVLPCHTQRLTDRLADAVPDVLWTWDGFTGLTELKVSAIQSTTGLYRIDWRPGQAVWLWRWARAGGLASATVDLGEYLVVLRPAPDVGWVRRVHELMDPNTEGVVLRYRVLSEVVPGLKQAWTSAGNFTIVR